MAYCYYNGVRYSDGSQVCQEGILQECRDGTWRTVGVCSSMDIEAFYKSLEVLSDEERQSKRWTTNSTEEAVTADYTPLALTRYADVQWFRKIPPWLYFSAGHTPGQVCAGQMLDYQVPIDDVISIDVEATRCTGSMVRWKKIVYRTVGSP